MLSSLLKNPKTYSRLDHYGMFERRERSGKQDEFWVQAGRLPAAAPPASCRGLDETLKKLDFARKVRAICEPAYAGPLALSAVGASKVHDRL